MMLIYFYISIILLYITYYYYYNELHKVMLKNNFVTHTKTLSWRKVCVKSKHTYMSTQHLSTEKNKKQPSFNYYEIYFIMVKNNNNKKTHLVIQLLLNINTNSVFNSLNPGDLIQLIKVHKFSSSVTNAKCEH